MINENQRKTLLELVKQYNNLYKSEPDLRKHIECAIACHSTAIEGCTLTENKIIEQLDIGKPAKKRDFIHDLMVFDQHRAFYILLKLQNIREKLPKNRYKISVQQ